MLWFVTMRVTYHESKSITTLIMLSVVMLSVVMLSVVMLSVVILSVMAPWVEANLITLTNVAFNSI